MAHLCERLPPTNVAWVRFRPGVMCGLSLLLILVLRRGFFSGFPYSTKTNISKFQFDQDKWLHENQLRLI